MKTFEYIKELIDQAREEIKRLSDIIEYQREELKKFHAAFFGAK